MQHRPLGRTGLRVSTVGFGGSPIASVFGTVPQSVADETVRTALDAGINYFDTSPYYGIGAGEKALGHALRGVPRDRYVLASKGGRYGWGPEGFNFSAAAIVRGVDESLARLGCDHLDVFQAHDMEFGSLEQIWNETLPAMERLRSAGKIRFIGITGLPLATLRRVQTHAPTLVDTVLSYCHGTLNDQTFVPLAADLRRQGVGVINAAPLAMGLLTRGGMPSWHPAPPPLRAACLAAVEFCEQRGASLPELALSYSFGLPFDCTVVGLAHPSEVQRAVACAAKSPDPALLAGVQAVLAPVQGLTWPSGRPENN